MIRFGIIGAGNMGRVYALALTTQVEGGQSFNVCAVCGKTPRAGAYRGQRGQPPDRGGGDQGAGAGAGTGGDGGGGGIG